MNRTELARFLGPWGWVAVAVAAIVVIFVVAGALGFRWDPWNLTEKRAVKAEATAVVAKADAGARRVEVAGAAETQRHTEAALSRISAARAVAARHEAIARTAPDANLPLDSDRARRLHDLDRGLCDAAPDLDGCAAATPAARDGDDAL